MILVKTFRVTTIHRMPRHPTQKPFDALRND